MDIKAIMPLIAAVRGQPNQLGGGAASISPVAGNGGVAPSADVTKTSFSKVLQNALSSVSESQNQVNQLQRDYQLGKSDVSLEQTMVAMQKAQIEFQAAVTVRNRLVSAYTDIMNMSV